MKKLPLIFLAVLFLAFSIFAQTGVEIIVEKANKLNLESKTAEAIVEISKAIALEPDNANLYITRANFNLELENKTEILKDAQKAASLAPTDRKILYFSASVLRQNRQLEEALKISDQLNALGDVDRFGWSQRIDLKIQLNNLAGAFEDVTTALELFSNDNTFKQFQAVLIRMSGDSEKALEIYNAVIASTEKKLSNTKIEGEKEAIRRDLTNFLFTRAGYYLSKSKNELAQADLIKTVNYTPNDFTYIRRAKIYRDLEMFAEAEADLTKALEVLDQSPKEMVLIERGDVYVFSEKYDKAVNDYQEALKLDATIKEIFDQRMGWLKQMRGKYTNQ